MKSELAKELLVLESLSDVFIHEEGGSLWLGRWADVVVVGAAVIIHHRVVQLADAVLTLKGAIIMRRLKRMSVGILVMPWVLVRSVERRLNMKPAWRMLMHVRWKQVILHHVVVAILHH